MLDEELTYLKAPPLAQGQDEVYGQAEVSEERGTLYEHCVRAITVDGPAFHNLGASAAWELAGSVAAAVAYVRTLIESGLSLSDALRQISFRLAADDDQFMTLAKMRALRGRDMLARRLARLVEESSSDV